jgi:Marseillevirus putative metallopeptidase WLM
MDTNTVAIVIVVIVVVIIILAFVFKNKLNHHESNDPTILRIKRKFALLNPKYAHIPITEGNSSYTENKQVISLCLKDEHGRYYDDNTLMYVALHELAHVTCDGVDHDGVFMDRFHRLLKEAERLGLYDSRKPVPPTYCGVKNV